MNNASLELGGTNWAEKDASLLGYTVSDDSGRFFPQEFTFSRGSNLAATRIGKTGLIEKGRENLLVQSNQFDTTWTTPDATITGGQADKDGGNNAWLLTATSAFNRVVQSVSQSGVKRFSVYAKANTNDYLLLGSFEGAHFYATFNLATGAVDSNNINAISPSIEDVGNGWYRCSANWIGTTTQVRIASQATSGQGGWASTTSGSIYIQDAQLEQGLAASPYIPTTTTTAQAGVLENTPRLNYTTGGANPYLLLEPSRTNLYLFSEPFQNEGPAGNITYESFDWAIGFVNCVKFGDNSAIRYRYGSSAVNGTQYTLSAFVIMDDLSEPVVSSNSNNGDLCLAIGGSIADTINPNVDMGNNIWKISASRLAGGNAANNGAIKYTSQSNKGFRIVGWQMEEGSYATSYIPTYSVSATRGFDYSIIESLGYSSTCTFYYEFNTTTGREKSAPFVEVGKDNSNKFYIKGSSANNPQFQVQGNGIFNGSIAPTNEVSGINKIAVQWSNGVGVVFSNGVKQSGTLTNSDTSQNIDFISAKGEGTPHDSKQLLFFEEALSDAELITLTTI